MTFPLASPKLWTEGKYIDFWSIIHILSGILLGILLNLLGMNFWPALFTVIILAILFEIIETSLKRIYLLVSYPLSTPVPVSIWIISKESNNVSWRMDKSFYVEYQPRIGLDEISLSSSSCQDGSSTPIIFEF